MRVRSLGALSVALLPVFRGVQLTLSPAPLLAQAPPRDRLQAEAPSGTGRLRGQVMAADSGTPSRRAQVRAGGIASAIRTTRLTTTDADDGRYEFLNLPAGRSHSPSLKLDTSVSSSARGARSRCGRAPSAGASGAQPAVNESASVPVMLQLEMPYVE